MHRLRRCREALGGTCDGGEIGWINLETGRYRGDLYPGMAAGPDPPSEIHVHHEHRLVVAWPHVWWFVAFAFWPLVLIGWLISYRGHALVDGRGPGSSS
jgi:hypothetical protein